jgi:hypothetical protein
MEEDGSGAPVAVRGSGRPAARMIGPFTSACARSAGPSTRPSRRSPVRGSPFAAEATAPPALGRLDAAGSPPPRGPSPRAAPRAVSYAVALRRSSPSSSGGEGGWRRGSPTIEDGWFTDATGRRTHPRPWACSAPERDAYPVEHARGCWARTTKGFDDDRSGWAGPGARANLGRSGPLVGAPLAAAAVDAAVWRTRRPGCGNQRRRPGPRALERTRDRLTGRSPRPHEGPGCRPRGDPSAESGRP